MKINSDEGLGRLISRIKRDSIYLYDNKGLLDNLMLTIKEYIDACAGIVTGADGISFDLRTINFGYTQVQIVSSFNISHEKRAECREQFEIGPIRGYHSIFKDINESTNPEDYSLRNEPSKFKCFHQTLFFDRSGNKCGIFGTAKTSADKYSIVEQTAIDAIAPYIFYAYKRIKHLNNIEFFNLDCINDDFFGYIITDLNGFIVFMNYTAEKLILKKQKLVGSLLPPDMLMCIGNLDAVSEFRGDVFLGFREIAEHTKYGKVLCYKFDERCNQYLPEFKEGYLLLIDPRTLETDTLSILSKRELEVFGLMGQGLKDKEIASRLGLSIKTIHTYKCALFEKMEIENRSQAVMLAIKLGVIDA